MRSGTVGAGPMTVGFQSTRYPVGKVVGWSTGLLPPRKGPKVLSRSMEVSFEERMPMVREGKT